MADDPPSDHFFKFVPPGFLFNLLIPTSFFLTKLNGKRCSKATLRRGCHEWSVEINEDGAFGDGWERFVRENGVQELDFIVFKHHGGIMVYDFLVFDQSSCERQYPNTLLSSDDEMDVEESDTIRTHRPKKIKKRKRSDCLSQDQQKVQVKMESDLTIKKKSSSTPINHPYYIANLTPSNFKKSVLNLSTHFSTRNGLEAGEMILKDDQGRSWKVILNKRSGKSLYIGRGINAFLVGNALKEGDTFKFELIEKEKDKPPIVNFFRIHGDSIGSHEHDCQYFIGELKSYNIQRFSLYLPQVFARSNGLINKKNIYLKNAEDERLWKVGIRTYKNSYYMGGGWKGFCVANGLKEGDCFKLKVVHKREKSIIKFHLQKKSVKVS